jgi:Transposase DDE domain
MLLHTTQPLFAWDALDDSPSLGTIQRVLATIPDQPLLESLRQHRGKGRDDCPLHVLWGVIVLTILLRHPTFEACLAELVRNDDLRVLIGLPRDDENAVPKAWNISRFLEVLGQPPHLEHLRAVFDHLVQRLGQVVPDLGVHCAGDATALNARRSRDTTALQTPTPAEGVGADSVPSSANDAATSAGPRPHGGRSAAPTHAPTPATAATLASAGQATPAADADAAKDKVAYDRHGLPLAAGGCKEYRDDEGRVTKVVTWFGYKCHLLVDVKHEVSLAYRISSTKAGDNEELPDLVRQGQANLPAGRIRTLAYDKAADDEKVHDFLYEQGIEPVIQNRCLWKGESERLLPGHDGTSNIVYDEAGTVYC